MLWDHSIIDSMDMNLSNLREIVMDKETWCAAAHRVAKSRTRLSNWTTATATWYLKLWKEQDLSEGSRRAEQQWLEDFSIFGRYRNDRKVESLGTARQGFCHFDSCTINKLLRLSNIFNVYSQDTLCLVTQLCLTLWHPMDCSPPGSSVHGDSPGKNTGVGCHALLQGIFPN